jgi:translation initiation factor 1 (eIF-1/SUI1)
VSATTVQGTPEPGVEIEAIVRQLPAHISGAVLTVTLQGGGVVRYATQRQGHLVTMVGALAVVQSDLVEHARLR